MRGYKLKTQNLDDLLVHLDGAAAGFDYLQADALWNHPLIESFSGVSLARFLNRKARLLWIQGDWDSVKAASEQAIKALPEEPDAEARIEKALAWLVAGEVENARAEPLSASVSF